jgi:hypothetical protein
MRRRDFIALLGGAAATWPLAAPAQQTDQMRRIGVLMNRAASDPQGQESVAACKQVLEQLGWSNGRNVQIEIRWGANDVDLERKYAGELVVLAPDVILASGTQSVASLQHVTRTLPIAAPLFDHFLGGGEQRGRHGEIERHGSLEIDDKLILSWRLHRHVGRLLSIQNAARIDASQTV